MDIMKEFEGIKRINNTLNVTIDDLYKMLSKYENQIGNINLEENTIICNTEGKYCIYIHLTDNQITIERRIDENANESEAEKNYSVGENAKSVHMSIADRMIEQIYDFIIDYIKNGVVTEEITGVQKILFSYQSNTLFSDIFFIKDINDQNVYEIKNNKLFKEYSVNNLSTKRQDVRISYEEKENNIFEITKAPHSSIHIQKNENEDKTTFTGNINGKVLRITADFTDNHFIVELDKIVIGAIDSLEENDKNSYRLEINNLEYEYLIISLNIILDIYLSQN